MIRGALLKSSSPGQTIDTVGPNCPQYRKIVESLSSDQQDGVGHFFIRVDVHNV